MKTLPQTPKFDLTGKRALVTGASSGIGLGCAVALAEAGAHVVCAARRGDVLEKLVSAMTDKGFSAEALELDIADQLALSAAMKAQETFDVVLNAAGMARHAPALDATPEDFDAVMNVNVRAAYFLSVEAAQGMIAAGKGGSIIHISSQMGHVGGIERSVYCTSKHAVEGMVKAMAVEWGKAGIRINTICPTFVRTALTQPTFDNPERFAWIMEKIKLPRVAEVEDIMGAALFLASDASGMVTGTAMMVDGGWTAD
ncbi:SDR family NAD(P)-dependent oxidoreductase [Sulfitobacter geojensis]|uniref:SDR family NAD(P)-dependent oxidoreductase n=1 Tax=Sulfitobacter geojensis TaxID=1342299 RepID=UPI0036DF7876